MVRSSSLLLGGRHVAHVSPSLGCRHPERWSGAAMRKPSPTRRRRQRRPSGCAMCQKLQQDGATATLGAAATARRSCILSLTLSKGSVQPLRLGRRRPGEWLDMHVADAGHANDLGDQLHKFPAWKSRRGYSVDAEMRGFNHFQKFLLCRRLRLHHPERCS